MSTLSKSDGTINLDYIYNLVDELIPLLEKDIILIIKLTAPIGTNDKTEEYIKWKTKYKVNEFMEEFIQNLDLILKIVDDMDYEEPNYRKCVFFLDNSESMIIEELECAEKI